MGSLSCGSLIAELGIAAAAAMALDDTKNCRLLWVFFSLIDTSSSPATSLVFLLYYLPQERSLQPL